VAEHPKSDPRHGERRSHPRYACSASANICEEGHEISLTGRVNELSAGGCYVEMMSPLRLGTNVRLELTINSHTVRLEAVVRTSQPNFGMGLQFTHVAPDEAEKLRLIIGELSGSVPEQPQAAVAVPPAGVVEPVVSGGLENALGRWFGLHDTLTRNEFIKLKQEAAQTPPELVETFSTDGK
jgi:ribosomal protein L32